MAPDSNSDPRDRRWQSVFRPAADVAPIQLPGFQNGPSFSPGNAIIQAWLSHAVYVSDAMRRRQLLAAVSMQEVDHFSTGELHWSLVSPVAAADVLFVAFRGTSDLRHWIFNLNTILTKWPEGGKVHGGFSKAFHRLADPLMAALERRQPEQLWFSGHSLGGALALLASTVHPVTGVYTFGCPRPGNPGFVHVAQRTPVYRIVCDQDIVTTIPYEMEFLNDFAYKHVGTPVHARTEHPVVVDDEADLPRPRKSWRQLLDAILECHRVGDPLPALLDHAPSGYVKALQAAAAAM